MVPSLALLRLAQEMRLCSEGPIAVTIGKISLQTLNRNCPVCSLSNLGMRNAFEFPPRNRKLSLYHSINPASLPLTQNKTSEDAKREILKGTNYRRQRWLDCCSRHQPDFLNLQPRGDRKKAMLVRAQQLDSDQTQLENPKSHPHNRKPQTPTGQVATSRQGLTAGAGRQQPKDFNFSLPSGPYINFSPLPML